MVMGAYLDRQMVTEETAITGEGEGIEVEPQTRTNKQIGDTF